LSLTLTAINDSRCKQGVQCIWSGEIAPVFSLSRPSTTAQELRLGTVRNMATSLDGYKFTLQDATLQIATVIVSNVTSTNAKKNP
jgi:hypothetical protein